MSRSAAALLRQAGAAGDSDGATEAQETAVKAEVQEVEVDIGMGDFVEDY